MRIAVTGLHGQVASSLKKRGEVAGCEIMAIGRPSMDLCDPPSVVSALVAAAPDAIVSAAAYTAVDKAESEADLAYAINRSGPAAVALAAKTLGVPVIHLSTDYVFDGKLGRPYRESDAVAPTGVYGKSKLAGESAIIEGHDDCAVLRVAWVYSQFGTNFVKTMLRLARERDEVAVVGDQFGNPTSAEAIANGILQVVDNLIASRSRDLRGVFHMTSQGDASWADFAEAIFATSAKFGGPSAKVRRITTAEYPTVAIRPANSRLNCELILERHGVQLPFWRDSLGAVVENTLSNFE